MSEPPAKCKPASPKAHARGWADTVKAVNTPRDGEDNSLREWMGLRPGEPFDTDAFDLGETNARMARTIRLIDRAPPRRRRSAGRRAAGSLPGKANQPTRPGGPAWAKASRPRTPAGPPAETRPPGSVGGGFRSGGRRTGLPAETRP